MTKQNIEYWVIPPECDAEFVAHMENVLETYEKPYNPAQPVVCMDEQSVQLIKETRQHRRVGISKVLDHVNQHRIGTIPLPLSIRVQKRDLVRVERTVRPDSKSAMNSGQDEAPLPVGHCARNRNQPRTTWPLVVCQFSGEPAINPSFAYARSQASC